MKSDAENPTEIAREPVDTGGDNRWENDDEAEIRYSLTALGEAALAREPRRDRGRRFRGFGPCSAVA